MKLSRRHFVALTSSLLSGQVSVLAKGREGVGENAEALFLSAASDSKDSHWVIGFRITDGASKQVFKHALPGRAHHIAVHEGLGIYVVIARRPGTYLQVGDLDSGEILSTIQVPADRHLYGHGVFSSDGSAFYAPENAWQLINGDSGRVVAWEVSRKDGSFSMTRKLEYPSYGVGPHELLLKADQQTLVVANGGIRTHPDRGREKLNINSMLPSLVYINTENGQMLEQHFMAAEYHKASIRHLDQNDSGQIVIGMQYEGEPFERVPLIALQKQGEEFQELWAPEPQQDQMTQYVGSVRFDHSGRFFAASCPRGNMITFWDAENREMLHSIRSRDGCGICAVNEGFLFTAGTGNIRFFDLADGNIIDLNNDATGKVFWDNHLSVLAV